MHQKFTITIDKNSPQALLFLKEHIVPYITFIDESCSSSVFIADYANPKMGLKRFLTEHKRYVEAKVTTFVSDDKITIMTDEDWTKALFKLNTVNGCSEFPDGIELEIPDDDEDSDIPNEQFELLKDILEQYQENNEYNDYGDMGVSKPFAIVDGINDAFERTDKVISWDYNMLIRDYLNNEQELGDDCIIKMFRTYTEKCPGKSIIEYWDSTDSERYVGSGHKYPNNFYLNYGKVISPNEIPDKMWHGMPTNIEIFRFDGYKTSETEERFDRRVPYSGLQPISEELAKKYQPTPSYVTEAEKELGVDVYVEFGNNGSMRSDIVDYYADTYTINDNVDHADTKGVLDYINTVAELIEKVDRSNDEFLGELGAEHDDTMITMFANYYSDDNDILEAYYDASERQIAYVLFQPDSDENICLTE